VRVVEVWTGVRWIYGRIKSAAAMTESRVKGGVRERSAMMFEGVLLLVHATRDLEKFKRILRGWTRRGSPPRYRDMTCRV